MEQTIAATVDRQRFTLVLMTIFASLALVMAATGVYSVVSYHVRQRERELGIRLALGATPNSLVRTVTGQELRPIVLGVVAGFFAALAMARFMRSLLFETNPHDPLILVASASVLGAVAWAGCYLPARRTSSIDPVRILRDE